MKTANCHLKQGICLGGAALALFQGISYFPVHAIPLKETAATKRFADWCLDKANLAPATRHTVDVLLQEAGTQDCDRAEKQLSTFTFLDLTNNQVADITPLSSLTNLTDLDLTNNQIADLKPLSFLTELGMLYLERNPIANKTCPVMNSETICSF
jgi:Leucine-rich repeat (LRR) protein